MGKIRTRILGLEEEEKKQKQEQKKRAQEKKSVKKAAERVEEQTETEKPPVKKSETKEKEAVAEKAKAKKVLQKQRGKNYLQAKKKIDNKKKYALSEAITLLKTINYTRFDQSVELHFNVDETGLKGEIELPHATGKTVRVAIVDDKLLETIGKGKIDFDILVAHPSYMSKLAKYAKILGPKGLMPNPKAGTISLTPEVVAKKFEKGTIRWKTEAKFPLIHQMIGKLSYDDKKIVENAASFIKVVGKPHIRSVFLKATMSPAVEINLESV